MKCPFRKTKCNISNFEKKITGIKINKYFFSIYKCKECGIGVSQPFLTNKEIETFHDIGSYRDEKGRRFNKFVEYFVTFFSKRRATRIMKFIPVGKILDIGSGSGLLLSILKNNGWTTIANELNKKTANVIRNNYGLTVLEGNINNCSIKKNTFDVINIAHVLEHMNDPFSVISQCKSILKQNGLLFIAIPNNNSLQSIFGQKHWYHLCLPYHLYHLTEKNLTNLLKKNNFEIKYVKHFDAEMNIFGWIQTILNFIGLKKDFLFQILEFNCFKKLKKSMPSFIFYYNLILTLIFLILLFPISLFLSVLESIIKKGGCIEVCAILKK